MKMVIEIIRSDGFNYYITQSTPIEYASVEAANVNFGIENRKARKEYRAFIFGGALFDPMNEEYEMHTVYFLDEWFEKYKIKI